MLAGGYSVVIGHRTVTVVKRHCVPIFPTKLNCRPGNIKKKTHTHTHTSPFKRKIKQCFPNRPDYVGHCILCISPCSIFSWLLLPGDTWCSHYICLSFTSEPGFSFGCSQNCNKNKNKDWTPILTQIPTSRGVTPRGHRVVPGSIDACPGGPGLLSQGQSQDLGWVSSVKN